MVPTRTAPLEGSARAADAPDVESISPGRRWRRGGLVAPWVLARTTGSLYVAGGLAVLLAALADPARSLALFAVAGVATATGLVVLRHGQRLRSLAFHALVTSGTALITAVVLTAPSTTTALALASTYTFVAIDVFYYFAGAEALLQLALLVVASSAALHERTLPWVVVTGFLVLLGAVALVIGDLAGRAARADHDALTGLLNRRGFDEALERRLEEATRTGAPMAVALLDVDHFKRVNDAHGHQVGDDLLRSLARGLQRRLPSGAVVGRLGGDEFALVVPGWGGDATPAALEDLVRGLEASVSAGVVVALRAEPPGEVLRRADAALYRAKSGGRGRVVLGDASTGHLAGDLAAALVAPGGGGLRVVLQPVVSVRSGRTAAVEALARWDHAGRGAVPPSEFVPVAEDAGLVRALGAFVLRRACEQAHVLQTGLDEPVLLTVNASGRELVDADYADGVLAELQRCGWPAEQLVVEVTESVVEGGSSPALASLEQLRRRGVRVAVDDFGAGYSTFSRLDEVPADYLKIDAALLSTATTSPRRRALVEAVLGVAATLGLVAIAEGVETPEQAGLLQALGCPLAQGYFYGRPADAADLLAAAPAVDPV